MFNKLTAKITRKRLKFFLQKHSTKQKVLEIGAKNSPYKELFPNSLSTDIKKYPGIHKIVDAHKLPFGVNSYPVVLCTEVLEHCHSPQKVVDECYRVLKPGGKLILTTRFIFPIHDSPHDYYRFTKFGLKFMLRKFKKITIQAETSTMETLAVILQRLAYQSEFTVVKPIIILTLHFIAKITAKAQWVINKEFGDIDHTKQTDHIMTSGYYVIAIK